MRTGTYTKTIFSITLDESEYFTVQGVDGKVFRVDKVFFSQDTNGDASVSLSGIYLLKSGGVSKNRKHGYDTWEHSRSFTDAAKRALKDALPESIVTALREMGAET
jgi:hypothetical protein